MFQNKICLKEPHDKKSCRFLMEMCSLNNALQARRSPVRFAIHGNSQKSEKAHGEGSPESLSVTVAKRPWQAHKKPS